MNLTDIMLFGEALFGGGGSSSGGNKVLKFSIDENALEDYYRIEGLGVKVFDGVTTKEELVGADFIITSKDGDIRWIEISAEHFVDMDGIPFYGLDEETNVFVFFLVNEEFAEANEVEAGMYVHELGFYGAYSKLMLVLP